MDSFAKYFLILVIPFFLKINSALAIEPEALIPIIDTILSSERNVGTVIAPRRVIDTAGGAEYSNSGNLLSRSSNGTVATFDYDSLDRLTDITLTNVSEPLDSFRLVFTYLNGLDERLSKIESISVSASGLELNAEVNFEYSTTDQFSSSTNGSFESLILENNQPVIFTVSVDYEPIYTGDTLVQINTRLTDDLGSPEINNVTSIAYEGGVVSETVLESSAVASLRINRRDNLSPFQQQISDQLIGSDGDILFTNVDSADYEEVECTDSNRLVDENLSILSLFYPLSPSTFFLPVICRD